MIQPVAHPARSFDDAVSRIRALQAQDDDAIHPSSQTKFWSHGDAARDAVLYLHGYTDSVQQFAPFAEILFERGFNVFAPRLPHHGYKDRLTHAHGKLTAPQLMEWTSTMTDTARGLGNTLTVIGLSLGGVLATWVAQFRGDVERVLIVAPAHGTSLIPPRFTRPAARLFQRLPNFFMWWDPRVREQAGFEYTYPRFATHTLSHLFLFGHELLHAAREHPPAAHSVWMITNENDFAVSNVLCQSFVEAWRSHGTNQVHTYQFPRALGIPHDLFDPADPLVKPEFVYPPLLEIIEHGTTASSELKENGNEQKKASTT